MFYERETGKTRLGNRYAILRDGPQSFHVTVQGKELAVYDHFTNVHSNEQMMGLIDTLENDLYPNFYRRPPMNLSKPDELREIDAYTKVGAGWHPLVRQAYEAVRLYAPYVKITTVKEKFGGLRVYTVPYDDKLEPHITDVCRESLQVCETCGAKGGMRKLGGTTYATRCEEHAEGHPEIPDPLGQMRSY